MNFARVVRLDDSDLNVFERVAEPGEWAIPGGFAFSNWSEDDLTGKARQEFANGWLGLETFGRASVVAVARITEAEAEAATERLARHFVDVWGAPGIEAARPVAAEEIAHMAALCDGNPENAVMILERSFDDAGVRERVRIVQPQGAPLSAFAVHGDRGD